MTLHLGDCREVMATMDAACVHAIVTDPPAGINFLNATWDHHKGGRDQWVAWMTGVMEECHRVLKPGGHALIWALPRTSHWTATAAEDAGFEIRDVMNHLFGSGFPKSHSVGKATQNAVELRYGKAQCLCLDRGKGQPSRDHAGLGIRQEIQRLGKRSIEETQGLRNSVVSVDAGSSTDAVCDMRQADTPQTAGLSAVEKALLLNGMCGSGTETTGHRESAIRSVLEEPSVRSSESGQGVPFVRNDARAERVSPSRSSSEAVSIRGAELDSEPGGALRDMPPSNRGDYIAGVGIDSDRRESRRVIPDNLSRRQDPVARVCSWCGLPDEDWLNSTEPLGTALKPAAENWILARKPLAEKTVAAQVLATGTGAINIDASRVGSGEDRSSGGLARIETVFQDGNQAERPTGGRWPSNVALTCCGNNPHDPDCAVALLDAMSGVLTSGNPTNERGNGGIWSPSSGLPAGPQYGDSGGASRFFPVLPVDDPETLRFKYAAKPSRAERNAGLEGMPEQQGFNKNTSKQIARRNPDTGVTTYTTYKPSLHQNHHPTVKSIALCKWLCRLITPPGGTVLDPFMGSGSTGVAAFLEGFDFIGIEQDEMYMEIARARISHVHHSGRQPGLDGT